MTSSLRLGVAGARCYGRTNLDRGQSAFVALSWGSAPPASVEEAQAQLDDTVAYWRDWLSTATFPDHPWRSYIERSALTLKGLSYAPTGAIMAAATTSLPETPGGARNWDYRYTWIRDSSFMLRALHRLGLDWEALEYFAFVLEAVTSGTHPRLGPADHVRHRGRERPDRTHPGPPHRLPRTPGRCESATGPGTSTKTTCGACSSTPSTPTCATGPPRSSSRPGRAWPASSTPPSPTPATPTRASGRSGATPNSSPPPRSCAGWPWTGAATWPGPARTTSGPTAGGKAADELKAEILDKGVDERGRFRQHYANDELDASLLLIPIMEFLPADDQRVRTTVLAIADELTEDGLVLRYKVDTTDTGFEGKEGTFTICSFWLVTALAMIGEQDRALALAKKLLSFAGPLQLYAEEIDATTGEHLGNFPQAFTHLALIDALGRIIDAEGPGAPAKPTA